MSHLSVASARFQDSVASTDQAAEGLNCGDLSSSHPTGVGPLGKVSLPGSVSVVGEEIAKQSSAHLMWQLNFSRAWLWVGESGGLKNML